VTNTSTITVPDNTIVIYSDLICPFSHIAVHRLFETRKRLGLEDEVRFDHHSFPIELLNGGPGTRHGSDSEIPALGPLEPEAGWQLWQGPDYHYPNSVLHAFAAIHLAKRQGLKQSEELDRALRRAFWAEIQIHATILEIAAEVDDLDVAVLADELASGAGVEAVFADYRMAQTDAVSMSPHLFLPDGTSHTNPGIGVHWQGDWAKGFPVVDSDNPAIYENLLIASQ